MKIKQLAILMMLTVLSFVPSGCGGGGGGGETAPDITVSTSKTSVLANGNDSATISAVLKSPVPDGTAVQFTVTSGTGTLSSITTTIANTATARVTSTTVGKVTVTASFAGSSGSTIVDFADIAVTASKASVFADGNDAATITAVLKTPVPDGTAVQFVVTSGSAMLSSVTTTIANTATARVTSTTVGKVTVTASSSGISGNTSVDFVPVPAIAVAASKGIARADGQDSVTIAATFASTVPDGTPVAFAITSGPGTLSSATANTVGNKASVTLKSGVIGQTTVQASDVGSSGTTTVNFPQPVSADVGVALNMSVNQVTELRFKLVNNPANSVTITQSNVTLASEIVGLKGFWLFEYNDPTATLTFARSTSENRGDNLIANKPFVQLLYTVKTGLPQFFINLDGFNPPAGTYNSADPLNSIPLLLTPSNFVVTVNYKDAQGNSF